MKISELSKLIKVPSSTIRDWERYLGLKVPRDQQGYREYSPEWVEYFKQVKTLQEKGLTYEEIKQQLLPPETPNLDQDMLDKIKALQESLSTISQFIANLEQGQEALKVSFHQIGQEQHILKQDMTSLRGHMEQQNEAIIGLRASNEDNYQAITRLRGMFNTVKDAYEDHNKALNTIQTDLKALQEAPKPKSDFWKTILVVVLLMVLMGAGLANYVQSKLELLRTDSGHQIQR